MTGTAWLLDLEIDGQPYRWSVTRLEVDDVVYETGLADLAVERGATSCAIAILDPAVDWPALVDSLEGTPATLSRWNGERVEVYCTGEAWDVAYDTRDVEVSFNIIQRGGGSLGSQVPDPLAMVGSDTFPVTGAVAETGRQYPVILGYPGSLGGESDTYPVVPVPIAQYAFGTSEPFVVIAEDGSQAITEVVLFNDASTKSAAEQVVQSSDLLGRVIRMANFLNSAAPLAYTGDQPRLFAGFYASGGGGPRSAYDVICYLLRRWGSGVDWSRLPEVREPLSKYLVDTWIDDPVPDPVAWISGTLLEHLPFEIRTGQRGLYFVERRYLSDPARTVGSVDVARGEAAPVDEMSLGGDGPFNEFTASYRASRDGDWMARATLTGASGVDSAMLLHADPVSVLTTIVRSGRSTESRGRYGLRQAAPIEVDWTWDEATVIEVLRVQEAQNAFRPRVGTYEILDGDQLFEGDEIVFTDEARGLVGVAAIVDAPPLVSSSAVDVQLRIPR